MRFGRLPVVSAALVGVVSAAFLVIDKALPQTFLTTKVKATDTYRFVSQIGQDPWDRQKHRKGF